MRAKASSRAGGRGDEGLEAQVGVRAAPGEVAGQLPDDVAVAGGQPERRVAVEGQAVAARDRLGGRRRPLACSPALADAQHVAGELLGLLDVGLVERVDAEDRPGDRGGDLPADELGAEIDRVGELDPDHRVAGRLERRLPARPRPAVATPASAIRTNARSGPYASTAPSGSRSTGTIPTPCLPVLSAMSCSTHAPNAPISSSTRKVSLSRPALASVPMARPSERPGLRRRIRLAAGAQHRRRRRQQRVEVDPDERRRDEADVGQRRVAAADVGRVEEDLAEVVVVGDDRRLPGSVMGAK